MNWRVKWALQTLFSTLPQGHHLNYLTQRFVMHSLPGSDQEIATALERARHHVALYTAFSEPPLKASHWYEFGAGINLVDPLSRYVLGVERQTVIDIRPLARAWLVQDAAARLATQSETHGRRGILVNLVGVPEPWRQLAASTGIDYLAPEDARNCRIESRSVDCVTSNATLEHIPRPDLIKIFAECARVLKWSGVMISQIDYQDHYSYFDRSISVYNFLRYGERRWRLYSPSLQFQNRLRHCDYLAILRDMGWDLIHVETPPVTPSDRAALAAVPLTASFRAYETEQLAIRRGLIVARAPR
jgi:SAM-dependent methyltransferase